MFWGAGRGERIDHLVRDQLRARVHAVVDDGSPHAFDGVGIGARRRQHDRLDPVDVVSQHVAHRFSSSLCFAIDADQDIAGQVEVGRIALRLDGAARDLRPGPAGVTRANDGAKLYSVSPGARGAQHPAVDRADVDRHGRTMPGEVELGVRTHGEHLALDAWFAAQQSAHHPDGFDHRRQRTACGYLPHRARAVSRAPRPVRAIAGRCRLRRAPRLPWL